MLRTFCGEISPQHVLGVATVVIRPPRLGKRAFFFRMLQAIRMVARAVDRWNPSRGIRLLYCSHEAFFVSHPGVVVGYTNN